MVHVDWKIKESCDSDNLALKKYRRFLREKSCRPSTVNNHAKAVKIYLKFCETLEPKAKDAEKFREYLLEKHLSNSTLNNYAYAMKRYATYVILI